MVVQADGLYVESKLETQSLASELLKYSLADVFILLKMPEYFDVDDLIV